MFFKISVRKSFANFTGMHLCWSAFLKNLQSEGLQLYWKKCPTQVFLCEVCEISYNTFFNRAPPVTASAPLVAASVFSISQPCYDILIIFCSWHIIWCLKCWTPLFINLLSIVRFSKLITWRILFKTLFFRYLSMCLQAN